ncbi:MAG: type II toxin-antitoxin system VapB family antitoxin [Dehalococcoidia bacterium]|nr:type II toxin-antitoxin system VapB family antitoxin [Dehalococcoidia bacterium]
MIDDNLLEEALRVLGAKGVRETVDAGLWEAIRRRRLERQRRSLGKLDLGLSPEGLSRLRSER